MIDHRHKYSDVEPIELAGVPGCHKRRMLHAVMICLPQRQHLLHRSAALCTSGEAKIGKALLFPPSDALLKEEEDRYFTGCLRSASVRAHSTMPRQAGFATLIP